MKKTLCEMLADCPPNCECPYCTDSYGSGDDARENLEGIGGHEPDEIV